MKSSYLFLTNHLLYDYDRLLLDLNNNNKCENNKKNFPDCILRFIKSKLYKKTVYIVFLNRFMSVLAYKVSNETVKVTHMIPLKRHETIIFIPSSLP